MTASASAVSKTYNDAVAQINTLVERNDRDNLIKLGQAVARGCTNHADMGNIRATILEYAREAVRFMNVGTEYYNDIFDAPKIALFISEGTYTIAYPDSEETFTFRVRTVKTGKLAGRTVVDYLKGSDPTAIDFETFAFVNTYSLNVFWKFERISGASGWLVNKAREIEKLIHDGESALDAAGFAYAQRSNRCRFCNHVLTDEESKAAGCGITCAENHGIPHGGLVDKQRGRKSPQTQTESVAGLPEDAAVNRCHCGTILDENETECRWCRDSRDGGVDDYYRSMTADFA